MLTTAKFHPNNHKRPKTLEEILVDNGDGL